MAIANMKQLLQKALEGGYAIGYFESWDLYSLEAALAAAEETASPAIFGFGGAVTRQNWLEDSGIRNLTYLARQMAERASVPSAVLFNEARTLEQIYQALDTGCNAVMLDTSDKPFEENIMLTRTVVQVASSYGADVEAELGHLPDGVELAEKSTLTDPKRAAEYVERTGINALAVSIGNAHLVRDGAVTVDITLLSAIHESVDLPLVLHGGSGFPFESVPAAIKCGVTKFNLGTKMKLSFLNGVREAIPPADSNFDIHSTVGSREKQDFILSGMCKMKEQIVQLMNLYGSAGKALIH